MRTREFQSCMVPGNALPALSASLKQACLFGRLRDLFAHRALLLHERDSWLIWVFLFPGPRLLVLGARICFDFLPFFLQHFLTGTAFSYFNGTAVDFLLAVALAGILADAVLFKITICIVLFIEFRRLVASRIAVWL